MSFELSGLLKTSGFDTLTLPSKIITVRSHGKKLIIELENQLIITGLGMAGKYRYEKTKHTHVTFILNDLTLYYNDVRRIGSRMDVINKDKEKEYFKNSGPCLLTAALNQWITKEEWFKMYYKSGNRKIVDILMDQKLVSGIGNYLRIDILYLAGIHPLRLGNDLTKDELELIRIAAHEVVLLSYEMGGHTLFDYVDTNGQKGNYDPLIYGKKKDAIGFKVRKCKCSGRTIHYVDEVQQ